MILIGASCFLAGMVTASLIYLWDGRIKARKPRKFQDHSIASTLIEDKIIDGKRQFTVLVGTCWPTTKDEFWVEVEGCRYLVREEL